MDGVLRFLYCESLCRVSSSQIGNEAMSEQCQVLRLSWHQRSYGSFGCLSTVSTVGTELFPTLLVCSHTLQWLFVAWCSRSWEMNALLSLCRGNQSLPPMPLSVLRSAPGATISHFVTEKAVSLVHTVKWCQACLPLFSYLISSWILNVI